ncbi:MAG TPA: hypothetical protein VGD56_09760 [Gemmatirosa sp.]
MPHRTVSPGRPALVRVPLDAFAWPSGIDQALVMLHAEPPEITARYGLGFRHDLDGLDYNLASVAKLPSGRYVKFIRHYRAPLPGTVVWVDRGDSLRDAWDELRVVLEIDDAATSWRSEFMDGSGAQGRDAA